MKYNVTNPTDHKQSLNKITGAQFINPRESIEIDSEDYYESEIKRAKKFLKFEEIIIEKKPTANVDKPLKNNKEVI